MIVMHLEKTGFTYGVCGIFTKKINQHKKLKGHATPDTFIELN